jgi:hypothetical protein
VAVARVVLEQAGAEAAGFYTDRVVEGRIVGRVAMEDVDGDAVLLELLAGMGFGVEEDVSEKVLAAMRSAEGAGAENAVELSFCRAAVGKRLEWSGARDRRAAASGECWHGLAMPFQADETARWPT